MEALAITRILTVVIFGAIAVASLVRWQRLGRSPAAGWVFASFSLLAVLTLVLSVLPDEATGTLPSLVRRVTLAALPLFPYFLYRFTATFTPPGRTLEATLTALTGLAVLVTLATADITFQDDEGPSGFYLAVLTVQWAVVSMVVAVRLWRAGRGEPLVARRRMRTLSLGSVGMTLALVLAGASDDEPVAVSIRLIAIASGALFFLGFAPPRWLRLAWRRPTEERLSAAVAELMGAMTPSDVMGRLLPHVAAIAGGTGAALVDGEGTVLGSHGATANGEPVPAPGSRLAAEDQAIEVALSRGSLLVWTSPYTPFFGRDEVELVRSLGGLGELALERADLYGRERDARVALEREVEFSERLLDSSADGILAFDQECRYTLWNPGMEQITGVREQDVLGKRAFEVFPFLEEIGEDRLFREALAGRVASATDRPYQVPSTGREGFFESRYAPLHGTDGQVVGGVAIVREVTEQKRAAEERLRLLEEQAARTAAEARAAMVQDLQSVTDIALRHLSFEDLVSEVLERIVEVLDVDTAAALLLEEDGRTLVVRGAKGLEQALEQGARVPVGDGFAGRVAAERRALVDGDGAPSLLGVPLIASGRLVGVLQVGSLRPRAFAQQDIGWLGLVADRVALALEQATLYQREHRIAETLQRSLLPGTLPEPPGAELAVRYIPGGAGAVGGDWYDAVELSGGRLGVAIGDVVGHGVAAAAVMGQLRSALRAYAVGGDPPPAVVERLDRLVGSLGPADMSTLLYLVFDPADGTVRFTNAGHPPPLLLSNAGEPAFLDAGRAVPLGVRRSRPFPEGTARLEPGATLVLYTDGLVERRGESLDVGLARLERALAAGPREVEALADHLVGALAPEAAATDDVALLVLRTASADVRGLRLRPLAEPEAVPQIRSALRRWLAASGVPADETSEILVAAGEACTNVVEHAYGLPEATFELEAELQDHEVAIRVRDFGQWRPDRDDLGGRGLMLMRGLMDSVEISAEADGTTVRLRRKVRTGSTVPAGA